MIVSGRRIAWWVGQRASPSLVLAWSVVDVVAKVAHLAADLARRPRLLEHPGHPHRPRVGASWPSAWPWSGVLSVGRPVDRGGPPPGRPGLPAPLRGDPAGRAHRGAAAAPALAGEAPRNRPWIRIGRKGRTAADLAPRLAELPALPAAPPAAHGWPSASSPACRSGAMWRGATAMFIVAGLALYLAGLRRGRAHRPGGRPPDPVGELPRRPRPAADPAPARRHRHHGRSCAPSPRPPSLVLVPANVVGAPGRADDPDRRRAPPPSPPPSAPRMGAPNVGQPHGPRPRHARRSCWPPASWLRPAIAVVALLPLLAAGRDADLIQTTAKVSNAVVLPVLRHLRSRPVAPLPKAEPPVTDQADADDADASDRRRADGRRPTSSTSRRARGAQPIADAECPPAPPWSRRTWARTTATAWACAALDLEVQPGELVMLVGPERRREVDLPRAWPPG